VLQGLSATRLSLIFFKAFAVSCFSRELQSSPPTNGAWEGPATSQPNRGLLALKHHLSRIHVRRSPPPQEDETSLTSALARSRGSPIYLVADAAVVIHNIPALIQDSFKSSFIYKAAVSLLTGRFVT